MVMINLKLLRSLREVHMKSVSDISRYLGYKTPTGYWLLEKGERSMSIEMLYKLAKLYRVPMEDLLMEKNNED